MENILTYLLFSITVVLANIVQTITGFAGTMLAMPPAIKLIGAADARFVLNIVVLLNCSLVVLKDRKFINFKELKKIVLYMALGCVVGMILFRICPIQQLLFCYGVFIIAVSLKKLFAPGGKALPPSADIAVLLAAGIVQGMFLSGGALLVVYASKKMKDKSEFRATVSAVWIALNLAVLALDAANAAISMRAVNITLINILPLLLSIMIGNYLHSKINQGFFEKITCVLLLMAGILACI